jgi:vacuolar-type H+-ATPase subunit H
MEILQLVDQFDNLLRSSWRVPLTSRLLVSETDLNQLIEQMRMTVPEVIKQAQRTVQERDRILAQAKEESDRIVARARTRAAELVNEHDITQAAQQRAAALLQDAEIQRAQLRDDADAYAVHSLQNLGEHLERMLTEVHNGIAVLKPGAS